MVNSTTSITTTLDVTKHKSNNPTEDKIEATTKEANTPATIITTTTTREPSMLENLRLHLLSNLLRLQFSLLLRLKLLSQSRISKANQKKKERSSLVILFSIRSTLF